jgi:acetyl-CoA C-acetyltransferase
MGLALAGGVEMMSRCRCLATSRRMSVTRRWPARSASCRRPGLPTWWPHGNGYSRTDCDTYAALSQSRALAAREAGLAYSMVPVTDAQGNILLAQDENIRAGNTMEKLAGLRTVYEDGANGLDAWGLAREPALGSIVARAYRRQRALHGRRRSRRAARHQGRRTAAGTADTRPHRGPRRCLR